MIVSLTRVPLCMNYEGNNLCIRKVLCRPILSQLQSALKSFNSPTLLFLMRNSDPPSAVTNGSSGLSDRQSRQ